MSSLVPNTVPGTWNALILKSATWPPTTISFTRDGATIIPVAAALTFWTPEGTLIQTINATIDGGGIMTIAGLTDTETALLTFSYGNLVFTTQESNGTITNLLAGNVTVLELGA